MPIYEYYCSDCNVRFNVLQKMSDPTPACPLCDKPDVKKMISAAAVLRSEGTHEADYRARQAGIDPTDRQALARFFHEHSAELSQRMEGQLTGSDAFAELLERVDSNAGDADMKDIENALVDATGSPYKMGEYDFAEADARLMTHSQVAGKLDEHDRELNEAAEERPGHQFKAKHPGDVEPKAHDDSQAAKSAPKSPWSSVNIGFVKPKS